MFNVDVSVAVNSVKVQTSDNGGLSNEQVTEMALDKIISVSENVPQPIRDQVMAYKDRLRAVLFQYLLLARKEERATICHAISKSGNADLAEMIRRL